MVLARRRIQEFLQEEMQSLAGKTVVGGLLDGSDVNVGMSAGDPIQSCLKKLTA